MKIHPSILIIAALSVLAVPAFMHAQTPNDDQEAPLLPPTANGMSVRQLDQHGQPGSSTTIRARLQSDYQTGMTNLQNNRDYRNGLMERYGSTSPAIASGTPPFRRYLNGTSTDRFGGTGTTSVRERFASTSQWWLGQASSSMPMMHRLPSNLIPPLMRRFASSTTFASSTLIQRLVADHQNEKDIRADAFAYLQGNLVQQSNQSLANLQQISSRISSLIQTETAKGLDMTKATGLLGTADTDISTAKQAIQALSAYAPSTNPSDLTASTTINLGQARKLGSTVISSIDTAHKDLDKVVSAITQAMGIPPTSSSTEAAPPAE